MGSAQEIASGGTRAGRNLAGKGCGSLVFAVFLAAGLFFAVVIGGEALRETAVWGWEEIPCTILASGVEETGDGERPWRAVVRYRYEVAGRGYESGALARSDQGSASYDRARDRAMRFPVGAAAVCRVDPSTPSVAVLEARLPWIAFVILLPLVFVAVGGGGLWFLWRPRPAPPPGGLESISQQSARAGGGRRLQLALGAIFTLVGGGLFVPLFALPSLRLVEALSWTPTPCRVLASTVRSWSTDDGTSHRADILYEYEAGGQGWRSNRVSFFAGLESGATIARSRLSRFPAGASATCWVDADDPARSVLERELQPIHLLGLIPLVFLAAGAAVAVHGLRRLRAAAAPATAVVAPHAAAGGGSLVLAPSVSPLGKVFGCLFVALFWNGIVSVFVWQAWQSFERGSPDWFLTLFLLPFVVVGLGCVAGVGYYSLALANPRPRLSLQPAAACLGDTLHLEWQFSGRASRIRRLRIVLEGREEASYQRGTDTVTDREVFAVLSLVDTTDDWQVQRGSAAVAIPDDTMHSFAADNNEVVWELKVTGEIGRWPDVDESFPIEVEPLPLGEV